MKLIQDWEYKRLKSIEQEYQTHGGGSFSFETGMPINTYLFSLPGDLAAISGSTPGHVDLCHAYKFDSGTGNLVDLGWTATIYNATGSVYNSGSYVTVAREPISGQFFVSTGGGGGVVRGTLTGALVALGSAAASTTTVGSITVKDYLGFHGAASTAYAAAQIGGEWVVIAMACPGG